MNRVFGLIGRAARVIARAALPLSLIAGLCTIAGAIFFAAPRYTISAVNVGGVAAAWRIDVRTGAASYCLLRQNQNPFDVLAGSSQYEGKCGTDLSQLK